jgi:hypothetical protein
VGVAFVIPKENHRFLKIKAYDMSLHLQELLAKIVNDWCEQQLTKEKEIQNG